jgi:poly(glycerol-phosphate) alpha-glucosyltransferase
MHEPIYMLLSSASRQSGGVTRNVLHRARLLAEKTGQTVTILTLNYNPDFVAETARMRESGMLSPGLDIRNFVEEMGQAGSEPENRPDRAATEVDRSSDSSSPLARWTFVNGPALSLSANAQPSQGPAAGITPEGESRGFIRDSSGTIRRIECFSAGQPWPFQTLHLDDQGACFLALWNDGMTRRSIGCFHFDTSGAVSSQHPSVRDAQAEWVREITSVHEKAVVFSDWRHSDSVLVRVDNPGIARIKTLHINHLAEPRTYGSPLQPRTKIELSRIERFDAFVALSDTQLADLSRQLGPRTTYHVVPNAVAPARLEGAVDRDPMLVVGIGRYHPFKRWDHAIEAFALVVEKVPEARLELWGFGPDEQSYRELVERLGLTRNVFIRGITHDSHRVLAGAALSVLTSPAEAFGLVLAESMSVGTPMVAFDVTYGLRDQITSGVNGVLVPHPDTVQLAEAIVDLLMHPKKRQSMGRRALRSSNPSSEAEWVRRWLDVIESACAQRDHRTALKVKVASVSTVRGRRRVVRISGEAQVMVQPPEPLQLSLYAKSRVPFNDLYGPSRVHDPRSGSRSPETGETVPFTSTMTLEPSVRKSVWDVYLSCTSRNAHRFTRLRVDSDAVMSPWTTKGFLFEPYVTGNGNLSITVTRTKNEPTLRSRSVRWLRRFLGHAPRKQGL